MFSVHQDSHMVVPEFITATCILFQGDNPAPSLIGRTPPAASDSSTTSLSPQNKSLVVNLLFSLNYYTLCLQLYNTQAMVWEASRHLCGAVQYKVKVKHQAGYNIQQPRYRLPAPGSQNAPYSPNWERAASFPVNQAFLDAVVEAVQALPVINLKILSFNVLMCVL